MLTLGSLFSGSGGFELAGKLAGIEPVWNSEIEPFPIAVTRSRLPEVKQYGDVCKLRGDELEPADIVTLGFPCQSVSIAGKREGMRHRDYGGDTTTRSGLFYEAIRIIREMRKANGQPRYAVAENVPGLFTSNGGEDFRKVIEAFCGVFVPAAKWTNAGEVVGDNFSLAWRVLDAQYWGVPQRRRRVYIVADFDGASAGEILFNPEGLCGDTQAGSFPWKGIAESSKGCAGAVFDVRFTSENSKVSRGLCYETETARCLDTGGITPDSNQGGIAVLTTGSFMQSDCNRACTLMARDYKGAQVVSDGCFVRRLTPKECARLQGFPSDWCDGVPHSDSAEYKLWGNAVALPCAYFVLSSIKENYVRENKAV